MDHFFDHVAVIIERARAYVGRTADLAMCVTYFEIGRMIVEREQNGKDRAEYGRGLLIELSEFLNKRFGRGFSLVNLKNARKFYQIYSPSIRQSLIAEFENRKLQLLTDESEIRIQQSLIAESKPKKQQTMSAKSKIRKGQTVSALFESQKGQSLISQFKSQKRQSLTAEFEKDQLSTSLFELLPKGQSLSDLFKLGWSHYLILIRIKNDQERRFYEIEAANQQWTVRQLQRQYNSSLYERLALSRDKDEVLRLAEEGQTVEKPRDLLKNPLILEFLGIGEREVFSESDLESAIISRLQTFLLELGKGFLFETRQKRFTYDEENFWVDLVFYNHRESVVAKNNLIFTSFF